MHCCKFIPMKGFKKLAHIGTSGSRGSSDSKYTKIYSFRSSYFRPYYFRARETCSKWSKLITCNSQVENMDTEEDVANSIGYSLGDIIGKGTYSKVFVAVPINDEVKKVLACKIIDKKFAGADFIKKFLPRELYIIRRLNHENIVRVYNIFESSQSIFIIMDLCDDGDLLEYIRDRGSFKENCGKPYFKQIADAVRYLHSQNIAHRDLKCENILIYENDQVKIGDFGFARYCVDEQGMLILSTTYCGSAAYAAPEIIQGIPYNPKMYDMWALGCILYIMLSATMPFDDSNVKKMLKCQLDRSVCSKVTKSWKNHSMRVRDLLSSLLEPDIEQRLSIQQVNDCKWLNSTESDDEQDDDQGQDEDEEIPH